MNARKTTSLAAVLVAALALCVFAASSAALAQSPAQRTSNGIVCKC